MSSWGTLFDASWWVTSRVYRGMYWMAWGTPESAQAKMIRETKERLNNMERKIEQIWALQTNMVQIDDSDPNLLNSVVMINENETEKLSTEGTVRKEKINTF